jgi:hypothetical protein
MYSKGVIVKSIIVNLVLVFCSVLSCAAQTDSTSSNPKEIFIGGGISYPYLPANFKDYWSNGVHLTGGYGSSLPPGSFGYASLFLTASYDRYPLKTAGVTASMRLANPNAAITGNASSSFDVTLNLKGAFATSKTSIAPYIILGVGFGTMKLNDITVSPDTVPTIPGETATGVLWLAGAGLDVPFGESVALFIQGVYYLEAAGDPPGWQHIPVCAGFRFRL